MTTAINKCRRGLGLGIGLLLAGLCNSPTFAQCDFVDNITGLVQMTLPTGNAADPALYTHTYVLVDHAGNIYATGISPNFMGVDAGLYDVYAVNYKNTEAAAVLALLAVGQPWSAVVTYGDDALLCLDYTSPYGTCPISVCETMDVCEFFSLTLTSNAYQSTDFSQTYCLVCSGVIQAISATGTFDLDAYGAATPGTNCQVFAVNYETADMPGAVAVGAVWTAMEAEACANCLDYIGMQLNLLPISQASTNGVSTPVDWTDGVGCAGAQSGVNDGDPFSVTVNNWCTPDAAAPINARPDEVDDLIRLMSGYNPDIIGRVPCTGAMDLTQNPIFYTVECDPTQPSTLTVDVVNPGGAITRIEAAMYGPVDPNCPVITGGTFVDCDDSGAGSLSGEVIGDLQLTTDALPGQVFLVIVDTEGREEFTIEVQILLSNTLLDFSGRKEEDVNVLEWTTSKEELTDFFALERSSNGMHFEQIGVVDANGNSQQEIRYSFTDNQPGEGTKYYRLKMVNTDGSDEFSKIVALTRDQITPAVSVYPNPTRGSFTAEFSTPNEAVVDYVIHDVVGREIMRGTSQTTAGVNKLNLDLGNVPTACYILSMTVNGYRINKSIIKN